MPTADETFELARKALKDKDIAASLKLLTETISLDDRHAEAHETLAGLCFHQKEYQRAGELFHRVAVLNPKNIGALVNAGASYNKAGDFQSAIKELRAALVKDRRSVEAYYNLGIAQRGSGQLSLAVSAYKEAIRLNPEFVEAYCNLGNTLIEMKNLPQAITNFRKALEIQPEFKKALLGLRRAEDAVYQQKTERNPFGRLVDMEQAERKNTCQEKVVQLSSQDRFDDRDQVHKVSKSSELLAIELLAQMKEELTPSLLRLSRLVTEEQHGRVWAAELLEFQSAVRRFRIRLEKLREKTDDLRAHEKMIHQITHP